MSGPVVVWGVPTDGPTAAVCAALARRGADVVVIDQARYAEVAIELAVDRELSGSIRAGGRALPLGGIAACFVRPQDLRRVDGMDGRDARDPAWAHAARVEERLLAWVELAAARIVNRPSDMSSNNSKPYQLELIRGAGFAVPETLVTTDPDAVAALRRRHAAVVYKSVSGQRSIVRRLDDAVHGARLADVVNCPTQFQEYVAGDDWRVHVVGEQIFACRIRSPADDYRFGVREGHRVELEARPVDDDLAERCVALARRCRLVLAGIDLRRTPDGRWYCFEVNPSPGFTYYQDATGAPIDDAIAALLDGAA